VRGIIRLLRRSFVAPRRQDCNGWRLGGSDKLCADEGYE
jgi:hypothetical protein